MRNTPFRRIEPGPGQESVWDYPRPPRVEDSGKLIEVRFSGIVLAASRRAKRVLETSHPPVYYLPPEDVLMEHLSLSLRRSWCEWKTLASYYDVEVGGRRAADAAWYYPEPALPYKEIRNYIAFYPSAMESCTVDGEPVLSQEGDFYGGWITHEIVGPFKGGMGTGGW
ncbi:MAG: DUF427 domain-containing protein [Acidobacteriota bacterium]|nr:DUF427 domain-containing protein [Acidobacteriota bacterium]